MELYANKRSLNRVTNHEGIKKSSVSKGNVRKNMVKVYHYEPIKCEVPRFVEPEPVDDKAKAKKDKEKDKKDKDKKDDKEKKAKQEAAEVPKTPRIVVEVNDGRSLISDEVFGDDDSSTLSYIDNNQGQILDKKMMS